MGRLLRSVICAPITTTVRDLATEVHLGQEAGLAHNSVANFDDTMLLARERLVCHIGRADRHAMRQARTALVIPTGCDDR